MWTILAIPFAIIAIAAIALRLCPPSKPLSEQEQREDDVWWRAIK
jgi:hypothetical protein